MTARARKALLELACRIHICIHLSALVGYPLEPLCFREWRPYSNLHTMFF